MAWKRGVKSLYYCRSLSIQRADNVSEKAVRPLAFTGTPASNDDAAPLPLVAAARASDGLRGVSRLPVGAGQQAPAGGADRSARPASSRMGSTTEDHHIL